MPKAKKEPKLQPFAEGSLSYQRGYNLPMLVGHLGSLIGDEEEADMSGEVKGARAQRLIKCQEALQLLTDVLALWPEDEE